MHAAKCWDIGAAKASGTAEGGLAEMFEEGNIEFLKTHNAKCNSLVKKKDVDVLCFWLTLCKLRDKTKHWTACFFDMSLNLSYFASKILKIAPI